MNFRPLLRTVGRLLAVLAAAEILPAFCGLWYGEWRAALAFLATSVLTAILSGIFIRAGGAAEEVYRREGILIVVSGWVLASLLGALPFLLTGTLDHPMDALFESASGFTTTGASVLTDIEGSGRAILFWRSFTQWLGGMGIIVLFVALLPELGPGARFLYKLEVPGPTAETLHPKVHDTALHLWKLYLLLSGVMAVLLLLCGLDLYDALTHTFSTLSTGGFSPYNASVSAFESPVVEIIVIVFMVLAGTNFSLFAGLRHHLGRKLFGDTEFRLYIGMMLAASTVICVSLMTHGNYQNLARAFLDSAFQVVSITTTTGYATADFDHWPNFARVSLVVLMFIGGCAGSTAGGMKVMRLAIGIKAAFREVRLIFSPNHVLSIFIRGKAVPESVVRSVAGFLILYFASCGIGHVLLTVGDVDLETSMSASIATLGNIGPGLHAVGPTVNYAFFTPWQKGVMVILMWLGRLEVYAIAAVVTAAFWRR